MSVQCAQAHVSISCPSILFRPHKIIIERTLHFIRIHCSVEWARNRTQEAKEKAEKKKRMIFHQITIISVMNKSGKRHFAPLISVGLSRASVEQTQDFIRSITANGYTTSNSHETALVNVIHVTCYSRLLLHLSQERRSVGVDTRSMYFLDTVIKIEFHENDETKRKEKSNNKIHCFIEQIKRKLHSMLC